MLGAFTVPGWNAFRSRARLKFASHIRLASTSSSLTGMQQVNLFNEYDRTAAKIVGDHKDAIKTYLKSQKVPMPTGKKWDEGDTNWLEYASRSDESVEIWNIARSVIKLINKEHLAVRKQRERHTKLTASVTSYDNLLRHLYPLDADAFKRRRYFKDVFRAYSQLPIPGPRYLQPKHLEDLISLFMSPRDRDPLHLLTLLFDVVDSGLPITSREQDVAIHKLGSSLGTNLQSWAPIEERFQRLGLTNKDAIAGSESSVLSLSSTMDLNVLLAVSFSAQDHAMTGQVLEKLKQSDIVPDRNTLAAFLLYEGVVRKNQSSVKSLYQDLSSGKFVMDMSIMNVVMMSLLSSGLESVAESCLSSFLKFQVAYPVISRDSPHNNALTRKLELIDYLLKIVRIEAGNDAIDACNYRLPLIPNLLSYGVFTTHYCATAQESKILSLLNVMSSQGILPDRFWFYQVYKAYADGSESWTLEGLNRITEFICSIPNTSHMKYFTHTMATVALKAYRSVLADQASVLKLRELEAEFQRSLEPPLHIPISNLLTTLSKIRS